MRPSRAGGPLSAIFARRVLQHPTGLAIETPHLQWSYRELAAKVATIADSLAALATPPNARVGLLFDQGASVVASMLGVLQVGAAYVPLDPRWSRERLAEVIQDTDLAALMVSSAHLASAHAVSNGSAALVEVDDNGETKLRADPRRSKRPRPPRIPFGQHDIAYILFTSGSTGRPRGVVQSQANVISHIQRFARALDIGPNDRISLVSRYSFDAAVMDIYAALLSGASLHPVDLTMGEAIRDLAWWLDRERITLFHSTPTLFRHLVATRKGTARLDEVRRVVLGGEPALAADVDRFRSTFPEECVLVNGYGPTECTVALQAFVRAQDELKRPSIPLGRPVAGITVSLRSPSGRTISGPGVGEIALTGTAVALGYWGQSDASRAVFLPAKGRGRTYLTRDLGRRLPDGSIEYVGRVDSQIKVRGTFLDTANVENALLRQPGVEQCAIGLREDAAGVARLVAFVVSRRRSVPAQFSRELRRELPAASLPSSIEFVRALPVTVTGKLDRLALVPSRHDLATQLGRAARLTEIERQMSSIWCDALTAEIDGDSSTSFFDYGGDSLQAADILLRVEEEFGVHVDLSEFVRRPSIRGLAGLVTRRMREGRGRRLVSSAWTSVRHGSAPLSLEQERYWARCAAGADAATFNVALALRIAGRVDTTTLRRAAEAVVNQQQILQVRFVRTVHGVRLVYSQQRRIRVRVHHFDHLGPGERASALRMATRRAARRGLDPEAGKTVALDLLRLSPTAHVLVLVQHHLVTDGWSRMLFEEQLDAAYTRLCRGEILSSLPGRYGYLDFAREQRSSTTRSAASGELDHWRMRLSNGRFPIVIVPGRRAGLSNDEALTHRVSFGTVLSQDVRRFASERRMTLFAALLACFEALLFAHTGQSDLVLTTDSANRDREMVRDVYGLFTNVLILRTRFRPHDTAERFFREVNQVVLDAQTFRKVPFASVLAAIRPGSLGRYDELFPVGFHVENTGGSNGRGSLRIRTTEIDTGRCSRDLLVTVESRSTGLVANFQYRRHALDGRVITQMAERFPSLVRSILDDPRVPLAHIVTRAPLARP